MRERRRLWRREAMFGRILAVTLKELRQLSRDRLSFGMIVGIPLMQMLLFGYAINFDVRTRAIRGHSWRSWARRA